MGLVAGVASGVRSGFLLFSVGSKSKMLIVVTVGVSSGCNWLPGVLLGFVLDFGMVRVSSHRANWVLSSSNFTRRIHNCTRVVLYLLSGRIC